MEATGAFWVELAQFLYENVEAVSVVNPVCIKRFAQSELKRTKTDKVDAGIIARFCQKMNPSLWQPAAAEVQSLQKLVRRLHDLTKMRQQERNRLSSRSLDDYTSKSVERMLAHLDSEISRIKKQIERLYKHHPQLQERRKLLMTIPGVGPETANVVLTEVPHLELFESAKQLAAFAGLAPREFRSGSSIRGRTRMSKTGRSRLRQCLYLPSVTARSCNPIIQVFCNRLLKNGKAPMKVVGAAMRKMLHIIFGVLKSGKPFDERIAWT
jgi:transposase